MTLKIFHIFFISVSIILTLGFGVWGVRDYLTSQNAVSLALGIASFFGSVLLICYLIWFLRKSKKMGLS